MNYGNVVQGKQSRKSTEMIMKMMSNLQLVVQDCVSEIFGLGKLQKCQMLFYQQLAGRLVNVTVELESALGEVNNIIEIMEKIPKQRELTSTQNLPNNSKTTFSQQNNQSHNHQTQQQTTISSSTTQQNIQSITKINDQLYKQYTQQINKYHHDKHSLNHQNEMLLNQWLQNQNHSHHLTSSNQSLYNITKTLIHELSKYESVTEYINAIESIEHSKIINQLKSTLIHHDDQQNKWFKTITKSYLLDMAELLQNHSETEFLQYCHKHQVQDFGFMY